MEGDALFDVLCSAERDALIALSLYRWLQAEGHEDQARLALVIHHGASRSAERMARDLEVVSARS